MIQIRDKMLSKMTPKQVQFLEPTSDELDINSTETTKSVIVQSTYI